ncbi:hypothetical protein KDK77_05620 [bacterium]|nr:hypothetical protein [bacterium]MCP5462300.1 hypothetical protein [bacterium]
MKNVLIWLALAVLGIIALSEGWALELFGRIGVYFGAVFVLGGIAVCIRWIVQKQRMRKDAQTIIAAQEDYIAAVVELEKKGASYKERINYLRSKKISKSKAEQIIANAISSPVSSALTHQTSIEQILNNTYYAWKSDKAAQFSPSFAAEARTSTLQSFHNLYKKTLSNAVGNYFEREPLKDGEFLLCIIEDGFLLTNLRLYMFHHKLLQPRTLFLSDLHHFHSWGVWTKSLKATLRTGEEISITGLDSCVDPEYVNHLMLEPII